MAITSLVFGIIGGILLAIVFGLFALRAIRRDHLDGKAFAIAGLILSVVWIVLFIALSAIDLDSAGVDRDETGAITKPEQVDVFDLRVGDCFDGADGRTVRGLTAVPCAQPHDAEVYAIFDLTGTDYPGAGVVERRSNRGCVRRFKGFAGRSYGRSKFEIYFLQPTKDTWDGVDDRSVMCTITRPDGKKTTAVTLEGADR